MWLFLGYVTRHLMRVAVWLYLGYVTRHIMRVAMWLFLGYVTRHIMRVAMWLLLIIEDFLYIFCEQIVSELESNVW